MEVVAHRVFIRQALEVRHVAVLDVIEAQSGRTLTGRCATGCIFRAEVCWLLQAIGACTYRYFHPGKQPSVAAGRILPCGLGGIAIQLLPHLVEAMDGTLCIRVICEGISIGQLERTGRKAVHVLDARVRCTGSLPSTACNKIGVIVCRKAVLRLSCQLEAIVLNERVLGPADERGGKHLSWKGSLGRAQQKSIISLVICRSLLSLVEVLTGRSVRFNDALGKQVP